jgi:SNF2 family DNA or RNA helicase
MQKISLKKEPNFEAKFDAFKYQHDAYNAIKDLEYAGIFFEQGLGKTKIAVDLTLYWLTNKKVDTVLIVTKKGLIQNWVDELAFHTHIKPRVLKGNLSNDVNVLNSPSRLILTHFELLLNKEQSINLFLKCRNVAIIIDESAKIKNPTSQITQAFFRLSPLFKKRVIMTGTPIANRPNDIWAQIYFLDSGKALGTNYKEFSKNIKLSNDLYMDDSAQEDFEHEISTIYDKIRKFCIRETKKSSSISLPNKEYHYIETEWENSQYDLYQTIRQEEFAIIKKDGDLTNDNSEVILKRLLRLVQIASNPRIVDEGYNLEPGKYRELINIIDTIQQKNEKCIIWTSFIENVEWLSKKLSEYGAVKVHGGLKISERNASIKAFKEDPQKKILIATPASSKEGLTLTVANHVIFYDRGFSLDDYLQAQDRIHRYSQTKVCHVYKLIMTDSIDNWVDSLLESKEMVAKYEQGDITYEEYKENISYDFGRLISEILNPEGGDKF